jgi:hypothetical protein
MTLAETHKAGRPACSHQQGDEKRHKKLACNINQLWASLSWRTGPGIRQAAAVNLAAFTSAFGLFVAGVRGVCNLKHLSRLALCYPG